MKQISIVQNTHIEVRVVQSGVTRAFLVEFRVLPQGAWHNAVIGNKIFQTPHLEETQPVIDDLLAANR